MSDNERLYCHVHGRFILLITLSPEEHTALELMPHHFTCDKVGPTKC